LRKSFLDAINALIEFLTRQCHIIDPGDRLSARAARSQRQRDQKCSDGMFETHGRSFHHRRNKPYDSTEKLTAETRGAQRCPSLAASAAPLR
jgi:hypothetical protein